MSSTDDTISISSMVVVVSDSPQDPFDNTSIPSEDERSSMILDNNVEADQDEGINDEPESDVECELTPITPLLTLNDHIPMANPMINPTLSVYKNSFLYLERFFII
jgi:hypothetical protein